MYLRNAGVDVALCEFFFDYLGPRSAIVIVHGEQSTPFEIFNQVFQGTVLGPPLWNVFFKGVDDPVVEKSFTPAKFADDLTVFKNFEASMKNSVIETMLRDVQGNVHGWGVKNRVGFDPAKEHFCILHRQDCAGETFKLFCHGGRSATDPPEKSR